SERGQGDGVLFEAWVDGEPRASLFSAHVPAGFGQHLSEICVTAGRQHVCTRMVTLNGLPWTAAGNSAAVTGRICQIRGTLTSQLLFQFEMPIPSQATVVDAADAVTVEGVEARRQTRSR
ncbi:MAG: hypothetical protein ACO3FE_18750, partial [Planctomycetaceae bacterium]